MIRHPVWIVDPVNYTKYVALGWIIVTDFGEEAILHTGAHTGWNAFAGFIPTKHVGVVALCSCDHTDADMGKLGLVLLHLEGTENLTSESMKYFSK